ncbi:MAG TPA: oligosaccharide flippase family protein [Hypericibacter adhaerens]|uniref:lipopolysaccharide biosynthesis protein n=1 Tax=Hypericibacter adhaerens TaxID=2602016 RepID=UPI002B5F30DC|nr:oligosaccharide flippase family protein [Hypericibacter adhaerens]HWA43872.1 oligosaccharide flippase family protein [Hypericibacter adhaerens]
MLRTGLGKSLVSLFIKVATAGLTYLGFVVLSRLMGAQDYGFFAFGLSLATILAIGANFGQQTAILRFWPEAMVAGRPDEALAALRAGGAITIGAGIIIGLAVAGGAALLAAAGHGPVLHLYAAAALILPLALAEYWSAALRAQGSVWTGLTPRDIVWRLALPLAVAALWYAGVTLSGWAALLLTAAVLALSLWLQYALARARRYEIAPGLAGLRDYWRKNGAASRAFFLGTVLDSAALNMDIIFVGLLVAPAAAGVYFNAFRTAGLLTLFMFAITLVVAPMVSQHFHAGEMRKAQAITALCAWAGFLFSLVVFAGFLLFGDQIMSLFGGSHDDAALLLIILSVGLLVDAATGPSRIVLMMTGHEDAYVRIFGAVIVAGMALQIPVIMATGVIGAAIVNSLARIAAQLAIAWYARRRIGLDTTLLGALLVNRLSDSHA